MKMLSMFVVVMMAAFNVFSAGDTPIANLKLTTPMNGNRFAITNVSYIVVSNMTVSTMTMGGQTVTNYSQIGGTLLLDSWTNEVGNVTSQRVVTAGVTNINYYGAGTGSSGGVTNGQENLTLGITNLTGFAKYKNSEVVNLATLYSNVANEITVDVSGYGQFTSITQALAYVDQIHATNATLYVNVHIVAGRYNENPVFKAYTVLRGDVRRTRIYGNTTIMGGPTFFDGFDFRTTDGSTPLTIDGLTLKSVLGNRYLLNSFNKDAPSYCVVMTNSSNYLQINNSEIYAQNSSATANAKSICIMASSGGFELVNLRLKTTSSGLYDNEYLGWFFGTAAIQVECCEYQVLHDLYGHVYIGDVATGLEWMDSSSMNNEHIGNFLNIYGAGAGNARFYGKETGALKLHGPLLFSAGNTNIGLNVFSDGTNTFQADVNNTTGMVLTTANGGLTNGQTGAIQIGPLYMSAGGASFGMGGPPQRADGDFYMSILSRGNVTAQNAFTLPGLYWYATTSYSDPRQSYAFLATTAGGYPEGLAQIKVSSVVLASDLTSTDRLVLNSNGTNVYTLANMITNQVVVSPVGSNTVATMWQGTYQQYLALPNKNDQTQYTITDDNTVYDLSGIYQGIDPYNVVSNGTTTIQVVPEKTVYDVTVDNTTSLKFDLSGLNFTNKVATFEVWVKFLNVAASLTWADSANIYWVSGTPSFATVSTNYFVMRAFATNSIHANLQYAK